MKARTKGLRSSAIIYILLWTLLGVRTVVAQEHRPLEIADSLKVLLPMPQGSTEIKLNEKLMFERQKALNKLIDTFKQQRSDRLWDARSMGIERPLMQTDRLTIVGAIHEGMNFNELGTFSHIHTNAKELSLAYRLSPQLSLLSSVKMGTSAIPFISPTEKLYDLSVGINYTPSDQVSLYTGISAGSFMRSQYINPRLVGMFALTDRLNLNVSGGMSMYGAPFSPRLDHREFYANMRLQYKTDLGLYLYGTGFTSTHHQFSSPFPAYTFSGVGGGVGYNIPGAGPVEAGITYVYNPHTQRMEPRLSLNLMGGLIYLIKKIVEVATE